MNLTPEQLHILQHSLGCDQHGKTTYKGRDEGDGCSIYHRNRFVTGPTGPDGILCEALVAAGLMESHGPQRIAGGMVCYSVTLAGMEAMRAESPPPPKLTRGQQRYRGWLNFPGEIAFIDFCRWLDRRKKEGISA